jgi:tRNA (mo5U34)-methyltransferase
MRPPGEILTSATRKQIEELKRLGFYHSISLPDGRVIPGFQSIDQLRLRLAQFPIPADLTGKRVLDIGAWDGWFSFEMERRGASVMAVDATEQPRFKAAKELLGSKVEYQVRDICRLTPGDIGQFDIVLFLGVLYHLKHPMLALENVCALSTDLVCVESYVTDDGSDLTAPPVMEFYETTELAGQFDNWVGPNTPCLLGFCRSAGFARVRFESVLDHRAHVTCYRKWADDDGDGPAPYITCVANGVSLDQKFSIANDDYVAIWLKSPEADVQCDTVFPQVGPYGTRPVYAQSTGGDGWQINCKLPPGLPAGWHDVSVRVRGSRASNAVRIGVDVAPREREAPLKQEAGDVSIELATDGKTWERWEVRVGTDSCISLWVSGIPAGADRTDINVRIGDAELPALFLSEVDPKGWRQVNALLPAGLQPGEAPISLVFRGKESGSKKVLLLAS